jgi:hypothetical protein
MNGRPRQVHEFGLAGSFERITCEFCVDGVFFRVKPLAGSGKAGKTGSLYSSFRRKDALFAGCGYNSQVEGEDDARGKDEGREKRDGA